ncbi:MAG: FHA domain-containing protein [Chloroflexi bacterium]|nr:FHA domain-containing protein [Chloroflexota bacterium]
MNEFPVIVAHSGPLEGQLWVLSDQISVGREEDCDVTIPDRQVSRHHALFRFTSSGSTLEDLGSKNGTFLNGQRVTEPVRLTEGDEIKVSFVQTFLYLSSDATLPLSELPPEMQFAFNLRMDESSKRVWVRGVELDPPLSNQQFSLLSRLFEQAGEVVSREELIRSVWGGEAQWVTEQAFDALVRRLRERLNQLDPGYDYIVTVRGHGLRLENSPH